MIRTALAVFIILFLILAQASHAKEKAEEGLKGGFAGSFTVGGGYISGEFSNLDVVDDNDRINNYDSDGDKLATAIPVIIGSLSYTFKNAGTVLFLGSSPKAVGFSAGAISGGITQLLGTIGSVTLTGGLTSEKVWKDPYLLDVKRTKTDLRGYTTGISLDLLGASLSYNLARVNVKDDLIGLREPDLDRDGVVHDVSLGYGFGINEENSIVPSLVFSKADLDGKSNSHDGYGCSLTHAFTKGRHTLSTSLAYVKRTFDKPHPVFDTTRNEHDLGTSVTYLFKAPFGYDSLSCVVLLAYALTDANISFFENNLILSGMGMQYSF